MNARKPRLPGSPRRLRLVALGALSSMLLAAGVPAGAADDDATVTTIAGTGYPGLQDGPAVQATFELPVAVAYDGRRNLYIVDAAAQRVRRMTPGGTVSTFAGGGGALPGGLFVPAGYADGPALEARFNKPMGIAIAADGTVDVADAGNHCIRKIAGGRVTTIAGNATDAGTRDGPAADARFKSPCGLALDRAGNLYIADFGGGVRKLGTDGNVTTIPTNGDLSDYGVAVFEDASGLVLFVSDFGGLWEIHPGSTVRFRSRFELPSANPGTSNTFDGEMTLGRPAGVAAIGPFTAVVTDAREHVVRLIRGSTIRVIAGRSDDGRTAGSAGFADGTGAAAAFSAPMGIAADPHGGFAVADAANRRIRHLTAADDSAPIVEQADVKSLALAAESDDYRIAYVGNSMVWYGTSYNTSLPAAIGRTLAAAHPKPAVRVVPFRFIASLAATATYVRDVIAADHLADTVVFQLNSAYASFYVPPDRRGSSYFYAIGDPAIVPLWEPPLAALLKTMRDDLAKAGIKLVLAVQPYPPELLPDESFFRAYLWEPGPTDYHTAYDALLRVAGSVGVPTVDVGEALKRADAIPNHRPLFESADWHWDAEGRRVAGEAVGRRLIELHPWTEHR